MINDGETLQLAVGGFKIEAMLRKRLLCCSHICIF